MTTLFATLELGKYHGLDWIAVIMMVSSMYALARQSRFGFIFGGISSLCWIVFGIIVWSVADVSANILCFGLNVWGFWKWYTHTVGATIVRAVSYFPTPVEIGFVAPDRLLLSR